MIQSVKVKNLSLSKDNVRKSNRDAGIDTLASNIAAQGLLQNLVVTPLKKAGTFTVKAGGRRLRALQRLIEQGTLPADHSVPFLVIGDDNNPIEVSLTENFQRVPMNPADECTGFNLLIQMGMTAEAQTLGGQVREGERSQIAIFYKSSSKTAESPVTGDSSDEMRRVLRSYAVFNCDQIDGLSPDFYPSPVNVVPPVDALPDRAQRFID